MNPFKNLIQGITFIVILIIQLVFLTMIIKEQHSSDQLYSFIGLIIVSGMAVFGHFKTSIHKNEVKYEELLVVIWCPIGALTTYLLKINYELGPVLAAAIVGTVASFLPNLNSRSSYLKQLPTVIYCGAFIGMSSIVVAPNYLIILSAGVVSGVFIMFSKSLYHGVGGKLGTIAFVGVVIVSTINWIVN